MGDKDMVTAYGGVGQGRKVFCLSVSECRVGEIHQGILMSVQEKADFKSRTG